MNTRAIRAERAEVFRAVQRARRIAPTALGLPGLTWEDRNGLRIGSVYFATTAAGAVKIGWGTEVRDRILALRVDSGRRLSIKLIVAPATTRNERALHEFFAEERTAGEFFSGPRIEAFLAQHTERPAP